MLSIQDEMKWDAALPCVHEFGVIYDFDKEKDYLIYEPEKYGCAPIDDDALEGWRPRIEAVNTYFHAFSRPAAALARYGVTLIPPESLLLFYEIVRDETRLEFAQQAAAVLTVIAEARDSGRFVIHFGV